MKDEEGNDVEEETDDIKLVVPSLEYKNAYALLDDPDLKPAFYKDYIFRVQGYAIDEEKKKNGKWKYDAKF